MVVSVSLSELSEQIDSVQQRLGKKLNIELNVIRDLSSAVKSYKDDPESLTILKNVVKLIFDINDSVTVLNEATSNTVISLLADCIMGTFNLLKKNNKGCENLCNDIINLVLVMAQKDTEAPNLLLKHLSNSLITILIYPKFDTKLKRDFLKILNYILENSDRPLRYKLRNYSKLEKLGKLLYKCGDFDFQVNIIETIFRYTSTDDRKENAKRWFSDTNGLISAFLNIVDFEPDCRKFLNLFNCSLMNERLVYSIPCCRAIIGNCEIEKPEGLQGAEENLWALQLTLFHPCYAIFSSIACNFEGNLCIFMFSHSNAVLVNNILQPIFGINYFSDLGTGGFKRNHKSSVSSSDFISESVRKDHGHKVSSINRDTVQFPKYSFKKKVPQWKNNLDKEISVNHDGAILGNTSTSSYQSFKGKSSNLPSKSKKQKSPFKPLEFINPSNLSKISNSKKAFQKHDHQSSSEPQFSELNPKDLIMEKKSTENISILNKNTEGHNEEIPVCDSSKGSQRNLPNEKPCGSANEENCAILAEDTDENSDIMKDSQSLKESSGKYVALRNVKTSKNDPLEEFQGRVLRSHIKAQLLWDASKSKTPTKIRNNSLPLNSNDGEISKLMEVELNDSDSDEWLKRSRRKSTQSNQRAVSLGALHMKQLYNKEVAMEKAFKKRGRKKVHSLKPSYNSSHNDHSENVTSKKKLFNSKEKSFLDFNGEKKRDKGNITFNVDEEVVPAGRDNKSVSSVNWFSENESESSWMKPGYKSGRFDSYIKERKQYTKQSESNDPPCETGEKTGMQAKGTIQGEKFVYDNARKLSGIKRDINSCSVHMKVNQKNSESSARDNEDSRLLENKRRKYNGRKTVKNDGIDKEVEMQEIAESNLIEGIESGFLCVKSDQSKLESNQISDPKKAQSLGSNREEKICNGAEPDAKSGSKDEAERRHENSYQNEFEEFSESKNRSVLKCTRKERLGSRKTSPFTQNNILSEMTHNHLPLITKQVNSSVNGRNKSSQDDCDKCPKESILSDNLNRDNSEAAIETLTDYHKRSPHIPSTKQKNEATISSEENFRVKPSKNINTDQGRNHSDRHSVVKILSENSKADLTSDSGRSPVEKNGKSPQNPLSKDEIQTVSTKEQYKIDLSTRISDLMEPQRIGRIDESPKVIVHSKDDNSMNRENLPTKENENDLNSELLRKETESIVSPQVNHEISTNENHLNRDQGMRTSNEFQNNSPDIIVLSEITSVESYPKMPKSVNDREVSHQPLVKQVDLVMFGSSPRFNAYLSCSIGSQEKRSTKAKKNPPKESLLHEFSDSCRLDGVDKSEDLILRHQSIQTDALTHFREQLTQKLNILEGNDTLRDKTVEAPEREDNLDLKEILSKSPSLKNFDSDVDLDALSLTEGDEKEDENNSKAACSTLVFKREDKDNQIPVMKRMLSSKKEPKDVKSILIEKISKSHERNSMDTSKTDLDARHSKRIRDLCKTIYSPVKINKEMFRDTSWNTGKAFDEIQEYDLDSDDLPQDINHNLTTWISSCQKNKGRRENNINSSINLSGIQSRKRRVMEPENIENSNSKVFQYNVSSLENSCNLNSKTERKKGSLGKHNSAKQQNFESENIPDLPQILMVRFEEKMGKMKELGNLFLKYTEDGMENLKDKGIILGSKIADEYLTKLRDEISEVEEAIQNGVQIQEELEKCMKNISEKFSLKAKMDSSAIEGLKKTHSICEDMHKENKKVLTSDYIEMHNSKLSSKIKQLHYDYMRVEWKKELAKLQNKLKLFLHL
ncbi:hypothetical protein J437_LFUL003451 [Ladona fulva]|uniref:Synaptonemal complex protein 2 n=1 Tax=Ladona fulva TaxID=123851 RepID=A0A8K0P0A5_LADFU|nr:hypothetical protein J437_LFUL003451 [Ladona fulva]